MTCNGKKVFVSGIVVAAGSASRMKGIDKQTLLLEGVPVVIRSLFALDRSVDELILVTRKDRLEEMETLCRQYVFRHPVQIVSGGETRQSSVEQGILAAAPNSSFVAIHDGARPMVEQQDVERVIADGIHYQAATLGVPSVDTVKIVNEKNFVTSTPDRSFVYQIQTPQVFCKSLYLDCLARAKNSGKDYTDDCQLFEAFGHPVYITKGSYRNRKITTPEDQQIAEVLMESAKERKKSMRIGHGYDVHQLTEGRKLILGGVEIPHTVGLLGHSDADVLLHAIMDALLGAAALGDIGKHFPDNDPAYKGADSMQLLAHVIDLLAQKGYHIENIDSTIIAQKPKLAPYLLTMKENIGSVCGITPEQVNVKATTEEKLGFTGECLGISAHAVALIG